MHPLIKRLKDLEQVNTIKDNLESKSPIYIHGLTEGIKAHLVLSLFASLNKNLLFIVENEKKAKDYLRDINNIKELS